MLVLLYFYLLSYQAPPTTDIYTLSLHDALPICNGPNSEIARQLLAIMDRELAKNATMTTPYGVTLRTIYKTLCEKDRSEEHTSELQSLTNLVCRLLLEKKILWTTASTRTRGLLY